MSDFFLEILYDDGTRDYIDKNYDGHKIERIHIHAMVDHNESENVVFGPFKMYDNGIIETSFNEEISDDVIEIKPEAGEYLRQFLYEEEDISEDTNKEKLPEASAKIAEVLKDTSLLSLIICEGYKNISIKGISKYY